MLLIYCKEKLVYLLEYVYKKARTLRENGVLSVQKWKPRAESCITAGVHSQSYLSVEASRQTSFVSPGLPLDGRAGHRRPRLAYVSLIRLGSCQSL